jgi:hypothetical protein
MPFAEGAVGLGKRYTLLDIYGNPITVDRPIFRPVPDTVVFSPAGPGLDYTTGIVTAGTIGVTTWSGEFHIPVCFLSDKADIDITLTTDAAGWKGITLQEVRE